MNIYIKLYVDRNYLIYNQKHYLFKKVLTIINDHQWRKTKENHQESMINFLYQRSTMIEKIKLT